MGLKWSSLRRSKDIVQKTALPPLCTAHVPPSRARTHSFVEGILQRMNDTKEDAADFPHSVLSRPCRDECSLNSLLWGQLSCMGLVPEFLNPVIKRLPAR